MNCASNTCRFFLCSAFLLLPLSLAAHDFRIDRLNGQYRLYYGHEGGADHKSDRLLKIKKLRSAECLTASKREALLPIANEGDLIFKIKGRCDAVLIRYASGQFTKTTTGTVELPRSMTENAVHSWISYEYLKRLELDSLPAPEWSRPFGERLEITPIFSGNPKEGDWVTLLVTEYGRPLASVPVASDGDVRGVTDANGRIRLRMQHHRWQIFQATLRRPMTGDTDEEVHTATLQFDLNG